MAADGSICCTTSVAIGRNHFHCSACMGFVRPAVVHGKNQCTENFCPLPGNLVCKLRTKATCGALFSTAASIVYYQALPTHSLHITFMQAF